MTGMMNHLLGLYESLPGPLQNLAVTLYGVRLYAREYGHAFDRLLGEFNKRQWMTSDAIRLYQEDLLGRLVRHVYDHVPYYRRSMDARRLTPSDLRSLDDLRKLPILTADEVRSNRDDLVARNVRRKDLIHGHTSGTTGSPLQILYDTNTCLIKNVADWRLKNGAGVSFGDRMAFLLGRVVVPVTRRRPPFWRTNHAFRHLFLSSFHLSPENLRFYADKLEVFRPAAVEGYPSTLHVLAAFLIRNRRSIPVKAAFTSSEPLLPHQRDAIETAFQCKVFDYYGMAERTVFATECEAHSGLHVNLDFGICEILGADGEPVPPGTLGRLVSTGLHNLGMPLLRYRTSDVTALQVDPCPCGRGFPLMTQIATKDEDIITTPDGRWISPSVLTHPFKPLTTVRESQIVQEDRTTVVVKVVVEAGYTERDTAHIVAELGKRLGPEMSIAVEFVPEIPRTKSGKLRWVISKVPLAL